MYESKLQAPLAGPRFFTRILLHVVMALGLLAMSIAIGMVGYVSYEGLPWMDAFLNCAMLLGGMGPVDPPRSSAGKLFAGLYALYAGLVFIVSAALIFAPVIHRVLHVFHCDDSDR